MFTQIHSVPNFVLAVFTYLVCTALINVQKLVKSSRAVSLVSPAAGNPRTY